MAAVLAWTRALAFHPALAPRRRGFASFHVPHKTNYAELVPRVRPRPELPEYFVGPPETRRYRDGTLVGSHPIYLSNSSNTIDTSPAISKSNDHNEWMIAWQRNIGTNLADIWGGRIRWDGTVTATPFQISNEIAEERSPSVSSPLFGGPNQFLVAWQLLATPTFHDIIVGLFQGNTLLDKKDLYDLDAVGPDQISPSVDSDGHHFLVSRSDGQGADYDIYATDLYVQGNALGISQHWLLGTVEYFPSTEQFPPWYQPWVLRSFLEW
jgi:hypothetical protein